MVPAPLPSPPTTPSIYLPLPPLVCVGLTSVGEGQGETKVLDWLEEVEEGGSDWLNSFFTFLYGLINPLEVQDDSTDHDASRRVHKMHEEDEDEEDEGEVRQKEAKDDGDRGQRIVIVGLQNQ